MTTINIEKITKTIITPAIKDEGLEMWVETKYTLQDIVQEMVIMEIDIDGLTDEAWESAAKPYAVQVLKTIKDNQKKTKVILDGLTESLIG